MALIRRIEELRPHIPVAYASKIDILPPTDGSENDYLVPILGNDLYQSLCDAYYTETLTDKQTVLLSLCRSVIAPFAFVANLPFMQTLLTNNGLVALESADSRKAFKWEYNNAVSALERNGYAAQEGLILFLQAHTSDYPEWAASPYHANNTCSLIRSGADLASVSTLLQPHRCFVMIKPLIDTVVLMYMDDAIGADCYQAFNARLLDGTAAPEDVSLAKFLRPMLARRIMEYAAIELSLRFNGNSFTITDDKNKDNVDEGQKAASESSLKSFREQMQQTATFFLGKALDYLNKTASASVFPEYFDSDLYPKPFIPTDRNEGRRGIFVLG